MASRGVDGRWSRLLLLVVTGAALLAVARAEDVTERARVASSRTRLRGAAGLRVIPGGLLSVGGSKLRYIAKGGKEWITIHAVPGDGLYRVDADERKELVIEILARDGARATLSLPSFRHEERDSAPDREVHGFGERRGGGYWLHWGDHILLLREGQPPRGLGIARYLKPRAEWAGADAYTPSPESLRVGVDIGAGREFVDVSFGTIEKGATELR